MERTIQGRWRLPVWAVAAIALLALPGLVLLMPALVVLVATFRPAESRTRPLDPPLDPDEGR
jgi:predicted MFS family arabinose efflux permease